ncbi:MAG TPA: helix-turn-helix transcriptional regulator [Verrucomicrobiae bacterium]|nr:helix-turn-helix transcriptional regulator [Verrucomicrobiae bacterium]
MTSFRQFKETAVFREYYGCIGVTNQMVFALENTGVLIALNRRERGFSDRDQAVISFLSPHISQAYQNARARAELSADIGEIGKGLAAIERAIIFADRGGRIVWLTALAREWLLELFPGSIKSGMRLPPPFAARVSAFEQSQSKKSFFETHLAAGPEQQLTARFIRTSLGKFLIVLDRERAAIAGAVANSLGLTRREGEILYWISEAKADREIAVLLGVSPRTVHKHVEHLFAKVGVDNRAAAQRLGWDLRRI